MLVYQRVSHGHENDDWMICGYHILGNVRWFALVGEYEKSRPNRTKGTVRHEKLYAGPPIFPKRTVIDHAEDEL